MKEVLLFLWQLPQNIVGLIVCFVTGSQKCKEDGITYFLARSWPLFGVSLGNFIVFGRTCNVLDIKHEHGHQIQSLYLGPLYLLAVGLPSICRNIYDRIVHKNWPALLRYAWYYSGFPEKWADKLGDVKRF